MQRLLEAFRKDVSDFIEQRNDLMLLASCSEDDLAIVLKLLRDLEQAADTDLFLLFGGEFHDAVSFVDGMVQQLADEHRILCEALVKEGRAPFPALPGRLTDPGVSPAQRVIEAIAFARSLIPSNGGHRLIWVIFPFVVHDWMAYCVLIRDLCPRQSIQPWMRGTRLIVRDEAPGSQLLPFMGQPARTRLRPVDFGPQAQQAALEADAVDSQIPEDRQALALYSLAVIDYGYNRKELALSRFESLLGYYQRTGNLLMQTLVMNGMGDVFRLNRDLARARYWYECAAVPAADSQAPMALALVSNSLGVLNLEEKRYREAEQCFDGCEKLATHLLDPESKVRALTQKGLAQEKLGELEKAMTSWEGAATLCRSIGLPEMQLQVLEHLLRVYPRLGKRKQAAAVRQEMTMLEQEVHPS